jgi:hypothetical protein
MAAIIVAKSMVNTKLKRSRISLARSTKESHMIRNRSFKDGVTAKQRTNIPFSYIWLKFKVSFLGLNLKKGYAI